MRRQNKIPVLVGLLIAWGGTTLLVSPVLLSVRISSPILMSFLGQIGLWLLCAIVIGIVLVWEKKPLASLWLRPFQWQSLGWASVLILAHFVLIFPVTEWVRKSVGLQGYGAGMQTALALPAWLRILAVLTAGIVEEVLFRGYSVTRILQLSSVTPAVVLSSAAFAALHLPLWGVGPSLAFFIGGLATTSFFVWRRDLLAMIIAHIAIDAWALLITPAFSHWWA